MKEGFLLPMDTFLRLKAEKRILIVTEGLNEFVHHNYLEANTDVITRTCGISKGSLYGYFGSKKEYYLYLVSHCLTVYQNANEQTPQGEDFYSLLFDSLSRKMRFVREHPMETAFLARAAREECTEVQKEKNQLLRSAMGQSEVRFRETLRNALLKLPIRPLADFETVYRHMILYATAIQEDMLRRYQGKPEAIFQEEEQMKLELKKGLDLMLYGILKGESI